MPKTKVDISGKGLLNKINSVDPVANLIIKDFYKDLMKASSTRQLTGEEEKFLDQVQLAYAEEKNPESVVNELLEEVYDILKGDEEEEVKDDRLYSVLEKVIFINAREKVFKKFFDDIEEMICSVLQLDYSKKVEGLEINNREVNIFNYAAAALNMLVEKMSTGCLSTKVVNYVTEQLGKVMIVVTDDKDKIRYVNRFVEELINKDKDELIDLPVSEILDANYKNLEGESIFFKGYDQSFKLIRPVTEVDDYSEVVEKVYLMR